MALPSTCDGGTAIVIDQITHWAWQQLQSGIFASGAALGVAGGAVAAFHRLLPRLWNWLVKSITISMHIDDRSVIFDALLLWLHHSPYTQSCRNLTASLETRKCQNDKSDRTLIFTPAPGSHLLGHQGWPIWLERTRSTANGDTGITGKRNGNTETLRLTTLGWDRSVFQNLIVQAMDGYDDQSQNLTSIHALDEYLDWNCLSTIKRRPKVSVILPGNQLDNLIEDARKFLGNSDWYAERGIPWRRGYLLYGPPGTGKTTLVKVLAGILEMDVAIVNLANPRLDDTGLARALSEAPNGSILLLEDIDAAFQQRDKMELAGKLTFSGLLNALDGVMAQEGHLLFMTTNHIERLDPALIRPGRIDVRLETSFADADMARRMFLLFFPGEIEMAGRFAHILGDQAKTPAEIQALLLDYCHDRETLMAILTEGESHASICLLRNQDEA